MEVAELPDGMIAVRDSKNPGESILMFARTTWRSFLEQARNGAPTG